MKLKQVVLSILFIATAAAVPSATLLAAQFDAPSEGSTVRVRSLPGGAQLMTVTDFSRPVGDGASLEADSATFYSLPDPNNVASVRYELTNAYILSADPNVAPMYLGNATAVVDRANHSLSIVAEEVLIPTGWSNDSTSNRIGAALGGPGIVYSCRGGNVYANNHDTGHSSVCAGAWQVSCDDKGIHLRYMGGSCA